MPLEERALGARPSTLRPPGPVVWVAGIRADERARCTPQTRWLLELTLAQDEGHAAPLGDS